MTKKVLIIENDPDIRDVISFILKDEGYEPIPVSHEPIDVLHTYAADLIILDEWLNQGKGGEMLCTEIKEIHELIHIPVLLLSTASNIEEIACACKADGFVSKPFDLDELMAQVNRCCGNGTLQR